MPIATLPSRRNKRTKPSALNCETKIVRQYLRVSCHGKNDSDGTPTSLRIGKGGRGEAYTFASGGITSLVVPFVEGTDLEAEFSWTDKSHKLKKVQGAARCEGLFGGADADCDRTYGSDGQMRFACLRGEPGTFPKCPSGFVNGGAIGRCMRACGAGKTCPAVGSRASTTSALLASPALAANRSRRLHDTLSVFAELADDVVQRLLAGGEHLERHPRCERDGLPEHTERQDVHDGDDFAPAPELELGQKAGGIRACVGGDTGRVLGVEEGVAGRAIAGQGDEILDELIDKPGRDLALKAHLDGSAIKPTGHGSAVRLLRNLHPRINYQSTSGTATLLFPLGAGALGRGILRGLSLLLTRKVEKHRGERPKALMGNGGPVRSRDRFGVKKVL